MLLAFCAFLLLPPTWAAGQEVRGVVEESEGGGPIVGAFVSLVSARTGEVTDAALTDPSGAYLVHASRTDDYRLRVERIGYETWQSEPFEAGPGRTVSRRLSVPVRPVALADLQVDVGRECRARPGSRPSEELARAWEEARKALEVARWTEDRGQVRLVLRRWKRRLEPQSWRVVRSEDSRTWETRGPRSFVSLPAEELVEEGWVRREEDNVYRYYAPDAAVLLSDAFLDTHCYWLVAGEEEEQGLLGLAFEPLGAVRSPDVAGVLWLEAATSKLERIDFRYVGLELPIERHEGGGRVEFARLPGGAWIVRHWWLRMPLVAEGYRSGPRREFEGVRFEARRVARVAYYQEVGGEVVRLAYPGAGAERLAEWGAVAGTVREGASERPLAGVEVRLEGTAHAARTDEEGRFRLPDVPPGEYTLSLRDPELAAFGAEAARRPVSVESGAATEVSIGIERGEIGVATLCAGDAEAPDAHGRAEAAALVGLVRRAGTREPVPGSTVWVAHTKTRARFPTRGLAERGALIQEEWERLGVPADDAGLYRVCGLPGDRYLIAQAAAEGLASDTVWLRTARGGVSRQDFDISPSNAPAGRFGLGRRPVAEPGRRLEARPVGPVERRLEAPERAATLRGVVQSAETGEPVAGATVRLPESGLGQVTGPGGAFAIGGVPEGTHRVVVEHLGMASDTTEVTVYGAEDAVVGTFELETRPIELPGLTVEVEREFANPRVAGYYERLERGLGHYITREDLERRDVVSNFRRIPGARVEQCLKQVGGRRTREVDPNCWRLELHRGYGLGIGDCREPLVYLDGNLLPVGLDQGGTNPFNLLQQYPQGMLEGIEVHRNPATAPGRYRMLGDACGIVLVWTRDLSR